MKKSRKIVAFAMALIFLCALCVPFVSALRWGEPTIRTSTNQGVPYKEYKRAKTWGDYRYIVLKDGTIKLLQYVPDDKPEEDWVIPSEIDGKPVTVLADLYNYDAKTITIPDTVHTIMQDAFPGCEQIKEIRLPRSLKRLEYAFAGCLALETLQLPPKLEVIRNAFSDCPLLRKVTIPKSVRSLEGDSFHGSPNLKLRLEKGNSHLKLKNGVLFSKDKKTLWQFYKHKTNNYTVPKTVEKIGSYAFCFSTVEKVVLPSGLKTIGKGAFWKSKLKKIHFPKTIEKIGDVAFCSTLLKKVHFPVGVKIGIDAFCGCDSLEKVVLPAGVQVEDLAFEACFSLKELQIKAGVKKIGGSAFCESKKLKKVIVADKKLKLDVVEMGIGVKDGEDTSRVVSHLKVYAYKGTPAASNIKATNAMRKADSWYTKDKQIRLISLISLKNATVKGVVDKIYTKAVKKSGAKQRVKVYVGGKALKKGRDYTVSYKHNKARGKATVVVTGINRYDGTLKRSFKIR